VLTIVIPTHNRPHHCTALLRMFKKCGFDFPVLFADSSSKADADALKDSCGQDAEVRHFSCDTIFVDKILSVLRSIRTPFVALHADDDILLPHAARAAVEFLTKSPDFSVAHGYTVDFSISNDIFDLTGVRWFTPSISEEEPLQRMYHLLRRYQPCYWAVIRRDIAEEAFATSQMIPQLTALREVASMVTMALRGKIERLPCIFSMRGTEQSHSKLSDVNPFYAMAEDSEGFFSKFGVYRNVLVDKMIDAASAQNGARMMNGEKLRHAFNLMHAIQYAPEIDSGYLNYTLQRLLDPSMPEPSALSQQRDFGVARRDDQVHRCDGRTYLWRKELLTAEPRHEIAISREEIDRVEQQINHYHLHLD
jgi:glycosyltransferase domain-containing protein